MEIRSEEISQIIREQIKDYEKKVDLSETGRVLSVGDGIARVYGVEKCMSMELLEFPTAHGSIYGLALNLEEDNVGVAIMGEDDPIKEGDEVRRTGRIAEVPVGDAVLGRVIDSVGIPRWKGPINGTEFRRIEVIAPGVIARQSVNEPMYTGLKAIDAMTPVGRGQRELIIGDRQIGKTAIAVDAIINQKDSGIHLYLRGGRPEKIDRGSGCRNAAQARRNGVHDSCRGQCQRLRPLCSSSLPMPERQWENTIGTKADTALIVSDDLSKQAVAYRQVYCFCAVRLPAKHILVIFSTTTQDFWRGLPSSMSELGGGSLTALPIIETQARRRFGLHSNKSYFDHRWSDLLEDPFFAGVRPAINAGLSVSRVGGAAQTRQ